MTTAQVPLSVVRAHEDERLVLEQLWTMFRHDMSAFSGALPNEHGRFRQERLDAALSDPAWAAYLLHIGHAPVGLAVARALDADEHVISSFFLVHGARRCGHGRTAVRLVTAQHPGRWAVAFQDVNTVAARFWTAVTREIDPHAWVEHRGVPGRPDLPADAWAHFTTG